MRPYDKIEVTKNALLHPKLLLKQGSIKLDFYHQTCIRKGRVLLAGSDRSYWLAVKRLRPQGCNILRDKHVLV